MLARARVCIRGGDQRFGGRAGVAGALFGVACAEFEKKETITILTDVDFHVEEEAFFIAEHKGAAQGGEFRLRNPHGYCQESLQQVLQPKVQD